MKGCDQPARYMNQSQICIGSLIQTNIVWSTPGEKIDECCQKNGIIHFPK